MNIEKAKGKSPYSKYAKKPFQYGAEYQRWSNAVNREGRYSAEALDADTAFRRRFSIPAAQVGEYVA